MVSTQTDIARAAIEASFLSRHNSLVGAAAFRQDMDRTRRTIAVSRELLKRLRQRQRDDAHKVRADAEPAPTTVSAFDADIIRKVFHDMVLETGVPDCQWRDLAKSLVFEFTGCEQIKAGLVDWIVSGATQL